MIAGMTGLLGMHWKGKRLPDQALRALEQSCPQARLHVHTVGNHQGRAILPALTGDLNLFSISFEAKFLLGGGVCYQWNFQNLKRVLLTCVNLRRLSLNVRGFHEGVKCHIPLEDYIPLGLINGERPPPLEELEILDYPFGSEWDGKYYRIATIGYPLRGNEEDYWAETFDWSQLRRLRESDFVRLSPKLAPELTAPTEVEFDGSLSRRSLWDREDELNTAEEFSLKLPVPALEVSARTTRNRLDCNRVIQVYS
ncbi:hypothetical protein B0T17DRAFT_377567 [Bombardia bombarda]|uniref:Uncharacterized protein n=1 Tax=Bombardia bombarda TaxID=252184 RepID=A0AA39WGT1_9PEZI|nr:hypothetical protein B0T17DRAFT_377567 [Bombardia bombarda]